MPGHGPGSPAPNLSGSEQSSRKMQLLFQGARTDPKQQLSIPGGSGWERGWPLFLPCSGPGSPEVREHRGQGSTWGHDTGCRYLMCVMVPVSTSISLSFSHLMCWSCSSCFLRSSSTDSLQDTGKEPTAGCYKLVLPVTGTMQEAQSWG